MIISKNKIILFDPLPGKKKNRKPVYFFLPGICKDDLEFKALIIIIKLFYILYLIFYEWLCYLLLNPIYRLSSVLG